jgi:prepilin-type N-terminal cleavage/methylation domain-containing protein
MNKRGFTLIELLVVIAIIGILSSVILTSLNITRAKARDSFRRQSLQQLQTALSIYFNDNGAYPITTPTKVFVEGNCAGVANPPWIVKDYGPAGWIPGLVPTYISVLPGDPTPDKNIYRCFTYKSDGVSYVVSAYNGIESPSYSPTDPMVRLISPGCTVPDPTFVVFGGGASQCN